MRFASGSHNPKRERTVEIWRRHAHVFSRVFSIIIARVTSQRPRLEHALDVIEAGVRRQAALQRAALAQRKPAAQACWNAGTRGADDERGSLTPHRKRGTAPRHTCKRRVLLEMFKDNEYRALGS